MKFEKARARLAILNELLSFPTIRNKDWVSTYGAERAKVGDLISLNSAPVNEWFLSWIVEIDMSNPGWPRWLLESVDTGALCWWTNVGLNVYRGEYGIPENWRWTDRQYRLHDRWLKILNKEEAYLTRPAQFSFQGEAVTIGVRERHNFGGDNWNYERTFPDWRKVTIAELTAFYRDGDRARESRERTPKNVEA